MPINITMPALSPTMEEGNLSKWLVKEGDKVSPGDVIAEIETDKATMEVEAVDEGTVAKLVVPAGTEGVKVNALIAVLAAEGEDAGAAAKSVGAAPAKAEAPKADAPKAEAPKAEAPKAEPVAATPKAEAAPVANGHATGERTFASPLARRIAREAGVDVSAVTGTGPHGRVVKADVDAAIAGGGAKPAAKAAPAGAPVSPSAAAPAVKAMSDEQVLKLFEDGSYDLVPHDNMRKTIARRLVEAKTTIPHFYLTLDCELDALLALRTQINAAAPVKKTDKGDA
ncbi:biotin/lipoyl-containing protein, partial [Mesorhizobium sp. Root695]|uniref:biotin/lipoyl-containing protein n=1 Tax=Mesorhizobium sp. Root695 TaxID=1736589 RepID=UPI0012E34DAA